MVLFQECFFTSLLFKYLTKDLRYEYNYGIYKVEAISALLCDGFILLSLSIMGALSVHELIHPERPSDLLVLVVGIKVINVLFDLYFFAEQSSLKKENKTHIIKSNYAGSLESLVFDSVTLATLLIIWLLRNDELTWRIAPLISFGLVLYFGYECIHRLKKAVFELTDKTLDEKYQMKILKVLTKMSDSYSEFHSLNSRKAGSSFHLDLLISFDDQTTFAEIMQFKNELQSEIDLVLKNTTINIIVQDHKY